MFTRVLYEKNYSAQNCRAHSSQYGDNITMEKCAGVNKCSPTTRASFRHRFVNFGQSALACAPPPRALGKFQVTARNCDWFIALFAPVVIGRSNCFGIGF